MKLIIFWIIAISKLSATPDWATKINETYLGSNEKTYATFLTDTDNQGSYYEWREIKKLVEYSKQDGSVINSNIISDILYTIDANHNNPNKPPQVKRKIQNQNKDILLAEVLTTFHIPLIPANKPEWISRLEWINGSIMLDKKLTVVSKNILKGLKIPIDLISTEPVKKSILKVHSDPESFYLVIKVETETDYNSYVLHISEEITKQLRNRINLLKEYVFIKSFKTLTEANKFGLEIIKKSQSKNFYGFNPEIWLTDDGKEKKYALLHRPLALPIDPEKIKRLDASTGINSSILKSDHFIEKWIPYDPNTPPPGADETEDDEQAPDDLLKEPIK